MNETRTFTPADWMDEKEVSIARGGLLRPVCSAGRANRSMVGGDPLLNPLAPAARCSSRKLALHRESVEARV